MLRAEIERKCQPAPARFQWHGGIWFCLAVACAAVTGNAAAEQFLVNPAPAGTPPTRVLGEAAIEPDHRYALAWTMKVEGEKSWRFRADFAGIHLHFKDSAGTIVGSRAFHTHCWQTVDWQPAWVLFGTPPDATSLDAYFSIISDQPLPGRFLVRDFRLEELDDRLATARPDAAWLDVTVYDEFGVPTPARIYVRDAQGRAYAPDYAFTYDLGGPCFYLQDPTVGIIKVPPGAYEVRVMKGFEYAMLQATVHVSGGEGIRPQLRLERRFNLAERGWHSGDHHTHLFRHGGSAYPMMNLEDVYTVAKAEGLRFLPFMGEDKIAPGASVTVEREFIGLATSELTRDLWGHLCPIGVRSWPPFEEHGELWPMNLDWIEAANRAGGAIAYAHPYSRLRREGLLEPIARPESGHVARELPIDLASGQPFTIDLLTKEDGEADFELKLRDYMRLLNLGFRVGVSGSTDFHLDQGRQPIGGMRTYVHADKLDWPSVAGAYREGCTFATNGPLVIFSANDRGPGDTVALDSPGDVTYRVEAYSLWPLDSVHIWQNGEEVAAFPARDGAVDEAFTVPCERSG